MRALDRKLVRELWSMRFQLLAIVLVVGCGVASFVAMLSAQSSLARSRESYYAESHFADVWAASSRAPRRVLQDIAEIPGVAAVEGRIRQIVTLDVVDMVEPATGTLVSISARPELGLNRLHIRSGRWPEPGRAGEVVVNEAFATIHGLTPGDDLVALMGGRRERLRIVGIALSPEYVYAVTGGSPWPDDKRSAILWMDETVLAAAFAMQGAFDDVTIALAVNASERTVLEQLDRVLRPWGGTGSHGRDLQTSHRFLSQELDQLRGMGSVVPIIFLAVAAFLLNAVLSRIVSGQREQIAALKALGYGNLRIGIHYAELAMTVVVFGSLVGIALGAWLGAAMVDLYSDYFRFPKLSFALRRDTIIQAVAISTVAGMIGAISTVRRAVALPPAEAMRPPTPIRYHRGALSRVLERALSQPARIVARNLARSPTRTLLASLGIAFSIAIIIAGTFSQDALRYVLDVSFQREQRHDIQVAFREAVSEDAARDLANVPGVLEVEAQRIVPVRLRSLTSAYQTAITGMPAEPRLERLISADLRPTPLPERGLVLTDELARRLGVVVGDVLDVEILEGSRRTTQVEIAALSSEMLGLGAYMQRDALRHVIGEGPRITSALLIVDPDRRDEVYLALKQLPALASVGLRMAALDMFNATTGQIQVITTLLLSAFASVIAVGVVYNGARIALLERSRELATLRVIGFTRAEVSGILLSELGVQLALAIPVGCFIGWSLALSVVKTVDTELFRFPLIIDASTYLLASGVVATASVVTALLVRRKIDHLDLVEVLKTRE